MPIFGVDVSHHQAGFDFPRAKREGVEFAILKATEGSGFTSPTFASYLGASRAAGLLTAAYHYQRADSSAAAQVDRIIRTVPRDLPVCLDVEANSGNVALTRDIIARLRQAGYVVPLLYLPRWYWQQIGSPSLTGLPPLWSSRYPDNAPGSLASEYAAAPASYWNGYGGLPVALLQFTSSATVSNSARTDGNAFRGTRNDLAALLGGRQEDDMNFGDQFTDWAGNRQTVESWMNHVDKRLAELHPAIVNKVPSKVNPAVTLPPLAFLPFIDGYVHDTAATVQKLEASVAGLTAAVAALSADEDLTPDQVAAIVRDAVQQSIEITGTVQIGSKETTQ